jgi:hypothetical protein
MLNVGKNRKRSSADEPLVKTGIDQSHDPGDGRVSGLDGLEDCLLAPAAMDNVGPHDPRGLLDLAAVAWQEGWLPPVKEAVERCHVVGHVTLRRCHDCRIPAHHMIA